MRHIAIVVASITGVTTAKEVLAYIPDASFNSAIFISPVWRTESWVDAIVCRQLDQGRRESNGLGAPAQYHHERHQWAFGTTNLQLTK